jgi:hypothetical protein
MEQPIGKAVRVIHLPGQVYAVIGSLQGAVRETHHPQEQCGGGITRHTGVVAKPEAARTVPIGIKIPDPLLQVIQTNVEIIRSIVNPQHQMPRNSHIRIVKVFGKAQDFFPI